MFQRYELAAQLLRAATKASSLSVLDVGGHPGMAPIFLPGHNCLVVDLVPVKATASIVASADALPVRSGALDIVLSLDVLEHLPEDKRGLAVREMFRVSREYVVLGGPFDSEEARVADRFVYELVRRISGEKHRFLAEHLQHGLPNLKKTRQLVEAESKSYVEVPNGYIFNWLPMMIANHYLLTLPDANGLSPMLNKLYNTYFYPTDNREPAYRQLFLASKNRSLQKRKVFAACGALGRTRYHSDESVKLQMSQLLAHAVELAQWNRARDEELFEKQRVIEELERQGLEKQRVIEELERTNRIKQDAVEELRDELTRIKSSRTFRFSCAAERLFGRQLAEGSRGRSPTHAR